MNLPALLGQLREARETALKAGIHFGQLKAMTRNAGDVYDRITEHAAELEALVVEEMDLGEAFDLGGDQLARCVDEEDFKAIRFEVAEKKVEVAHAT